MGIREIKVKIKNIDKSNFKFIVVCLIFGYLVFCFVDGKTIEKIGVVAATVIAMAAFRIQSFAYIKEKIEDRQKEILKNCGLIKNELLMKKIHDTNGNIKFSRFGEDGIKLFERKHNINVEIDFTFENSTKSGALVIIIKNLIGDNIEVYEEPYKYIYYVFTGATNGVTIFDIRDCDDDGKEVKSYKTEQLSIEEIGNHEWSEIRDTIVKVLASYVIERIS